MLPDKNKKIFLNEGRAVGGHLFNYGGFPRISKLNENGIVSQYNDADDKPGDEQIATEPDGLTALEIALKKMRSEFEEQEHNLSDPEYRWSASSSGRKAMGEILRMEEKIRQHPEFKAKVAAAEAARAAEGPGFFSQRGARRDDFNRIDTPEERGLNRGPKRLPPTDYDLGRSSHKDR